MSDVFVIRNQYGHYWAKARAWVDGSDPRMVLRVVHRDEAVNTLVELSSRDVELRGQVIGAVLNDRGVPVIEPSQIPLPVAEDTDDGQEPVAEPPPEARDDASLAAAGGA